MKLSIFSIFFCLTALTYGHHLKAEECSNLSHQKVIEQLDTVIDYVQFDCAGFNKIFRQISSGEIFLEETIHFGREWKEEKKDNEIEKSVKKLRIYWSPDKTRLFEDYVMDGQRHVVAKLSAFYTSRSESYFVHNNRVIKDGYHYQRLEFRTEGPQIKSFDTHKSYPRLSP